MLELLSAVGGILLADIVLSGDNALVIGAAASGLPQQQRRLAILLGGGGAVVLRIVFAFIASFLLSLPWLQAIGGLILLVIAIRLLADRQHTQQSEGQHTHEQSKQEGKQSFLPAMLTILVADVTMSLDNVLAVGALAHGNLIALSIGILLSIVLLLVGSSLIATLMHRLPWLLDLAALVLGWTAADMILNDLRLADILDSYPWTDIAIPAVSLGIVVIADIFLRMRDQRRTRLSGAR